MSFNTVLNLAILFVYYLSLTTFNILVAATSFILKNVAITFWSFVIIAIIFATLLVLSFIPHILVFILYYLDQIRVILINLLVITVANGLRIVYGLVVPIWGTSQEIILAILQAFWQNFCPEQDLGVCIGIDQFFFFLEDLSTAFSLFAELVIAQLNIFQVLVFEFICDLAIYNPELEEFFCNINPLRHARLDAIIANNTSVYIEQSFWEGIQVVMGVIGSFARIAVNEGLTYLGITLLFTGSLVLILLKYAFIAATIITSYLLTLITGFIYAASPPDRSTNFNATTTFEQTFDLSRSQLTSQLFMLDPFQLFNESKFSCPKVEGYCEFLENVLIQTNHTLYTTFIKVPIIFMWVDSMLCAFSNIRECGGDIDLCGFMFDSDGVVVQTGAALLKALRDALLSLPIPINLSLLFYSEDCKSIDPNGFGAQEVCVIKEIFAGPKILCNSLFNVGACPCWACQIDRDIQDQIFDLFQIGPFTKRGVPCNIITQTENACCLAGEGQTYFDEQCVERETSAYISIFYFLFQIIFLGNADEFLNDKPLRCNEDIGAKFWFLTTDLLERVNVFWDVLFSTVFQESFRISVNHPLGFPELPPGPVNHLPYTRLTYTSYGYLYVAPLDGTPSNFILAGNLQVDPRYLSYRQLLYSFTIGCYGPHFRNYYYSDLYDHEYEFANFGQLILGVFQDSMFTTENEVSFSIEFSDDLHNALSIPITTKFPSPAKAGVGIRIQHDESVAICPNMLKMEKHLQDTFIDDFDAYNDCRFFTMHSYVKELNEKRLSILIEEAFDAFSDIVGNISTVEFKLRDEFIGFPIFINEIKPTTFIHLMDQNKFDLMVNIINIDLLEPNSTLIVEELLTGDVTGDFVFDLGETVCNVFTVDPGGPGGIFGTRNENNYGYQGVLNNLLFVDQGRNSYFNFYNWISPLESLLNINQDDCRLLVTENFEGNLTKRQIWVDLFLSPNTVEATLFMLNNMESTKVVREPPFNNVFTGREDFAHELSKQYLVIKVMKEKYFIPKILIHVLDKFIDSDPCNPPILNDIFPFDSNFFNHSNPIPANCVSELPFVEIFLRYFLRYQGSGWYRLIIDDEVHPDNLCSRIDISVELVQSMEFYFGNVLVLERWLLDPFFNNNFANAANLIYNFIELLNLNTTLEWINDMDYDVEESTTFCANVGEIPPLFAVQLPKTECFLYMQALNNTNNLYTQFKEDFFSGDKTHCEIMKSFLENVFDYGFDLTPSELNDVIDDFGDLVDCDEIVMERQPIQNQTQVDCF